MAPNCRSCLRRGRGILQHGQPPSDVISRIVRLVSETRLVLPRSIYPLLISARGLVDEAICLPIRGDSCGNFWPRSSATGDLLLWAWCSSATHSEQLASSLAPQPGCLFSDHHMIFLRPFVSWPLPIGPASDCQSLLNSGTLQNQLSMRTNCSVGCALRNPAEAIRVVGRLKPIRAPAWAVWGVGEGTVHPHRQPRVTVILHGRIRPFHKIALRSRLLRRPPSRSRRKATKREPCPRTRVLTCPACMYCTGTDILDNGEQPQFLALSHRAYAVNVYGTQLTAKACWMPRCLPSEGAVSRFCGCSNSPGRGPLQMRIVGMAGQLRARGLHT